MMMLLFILFSNAAWSQLSDEYRFQLEGIFQQDPSNISANGVRFSLRWNEVTGKISGTYSDTFFTNGAPVIGTSGVSGRSFQVILPDTSRGARSIDVSLLNPGIGNGTVEITMTPKSLYGEPMSTYSVKALMNTEVPTILEPRNVCVLGMGALTGQCGTYAGPIIEQSDRSNKCQDRLANSKLELTVAGDFLLHVGEGEDHVIGGLNGIAPLTTTVNVSSRHCGSLSLTTFREVNCQDLRLTGSFTGGRRFTGNYSITDILTRERCSFRMMLERAGI